MQICLEINVWNKPLLGTSTINFLFRSSGPTGLLVSRSYRLFETYKAVLLLVNDQRVTIVRYGIIFRTIFL